MKGRSASGLWGVLSHWSSHDWRILEDYRKTNGICKGPWILRIDDSCCLKALLWLLIISIIPLHPNARYDWIRKTYQSNTGTRFLGDTLWKVTWNRKNDAFQDGNILFRWFSFAKLESHKGFVQLLSSPNGCFKSDRFEKYMLGTLVKCILVLAKYFTNSQQVPTSMRTHNLNFQGLRPMLLGLKTFIFHGVQKLLIYRRFQMGASNECFVDRLRWIHSFKVCRKAPTAPSPNW